MPKLTAFNRNKKIDKLRSGFTLRKLINICLHNSTYDKLFSFSEADEFLQKGRLGGWAIFYVHV